MNGHFQCDANMMGRFGERPAGFGGFGGPQQFMPGMGSWARRGMPSAHYPATEAEAKEWAAKETAEAAKETPDDGAGTAPERPEALPFGCRVGGWPRRPWGHRAMARAAMMRGMYPGMVSGCHPGAMACMWPGLHHPGMGMGQRPGMMDPSCLGMMGMNHPGMMGMNHPGMMGMNHPGMMGMNHPGMMGMNHPGMIGHPGMGHAAAAAMGHPAISGMPVPCGAGSGTHQCLVQQHFHHHHHQGGGAGPRGGMPAWWPMAQPPAWWPMAHPPASGAKGVAAAKGTSDGEDELELEMAGGEVPECRFNRSMKGRRMMKRQVEQMKQHREALNQRIEECEEVIKKMEARKKGKGEGDVGEAGAGQTLLEGEKKTQVVCVDDVSSA